MLPSSRNFQLMKISISWIWWVVWSGVWKCRQLVLSYIYCHPFFGFQNWACGSVHFALSKKFHKIYISCQNLLLPEFSFTFACTHFLNQKPKGRRFQNFPTFFNEICPKLCNLVTFDKIEWFLKKEFTKSIFFHDLWIEFKKWVQGEMGEKSGCTLYSHSGAILDTFSIGMKGAGQGFLLPNG